MSKDSMEYLKHIRDECLYLMSVIESGVSKEDFTANQVNSSTAVYQHR